MDMKQDHMAFGQFSLPQNSANFWLHAAICNSRKIKPIVQLHGILPFLTALDSIYEYLFYADSM